MRKRTSVVLVALVVTVAGALIGMAWFNQGAESGATSSAREPLYWVAPMDSSFRRDEPGLSPMGMELVPVYEEQGDENAITVSSAVQQNLGLRTAPVVREDFSRVLSTVGYTRWNGSTIQMLHPRAEGWLEVFNLDSVGDRVEAGEVVYELFAPNLVSAQREYLNARQANNQTLAAAARDRLLALGFTERQIEALNRNGEVSLRLVYVAERDGLVTDIGVREGSYVQPQTSIATLASLDTIWIDTEVFESDAGAIQTGQRASVSFPAFPGEVWEAEIAYVYPELDPDTRALRTRLVVNNPDHRLKPNMFANVVIQGTPRPNVLTVPREAVIRSGAGNRVIMALPEGRFRAQAVATGISSDGRTEILQGLEEGDVVVSSGQFLLDSEANGEQALARLEGGMDSQATGTYSSGEEPDGTRFSTTGTITRISDGVTLTISHAPVEALGWPAMEMGFAVPPQVDIDGLEVDDEVRFEFEQADDGTYRIITIEEYAQGR